MIIPGARTVSLIRPESTRAVLVLHGYTGYTKEMRFLSEELYGAGFSVLAPRLPGHGTNNRDFRATGSTDWWRAAVEGFLELSDGHSEVMVAGLSMGAVLTVLLAAQFPVARAALLAPALDFSNRLVPFTPLLRYVVPPLRNNEEDDESRSEPEDPERDLLAEEYWNWKWPRQTAELFRLARAARRALPRITCPTITVVSEKDETVPLRVASRIADRIGSAERETIVLKESGHVVTDGVEREEVARVVTEWFLR